MTVEVRSSVNYFFIHIYEKQTSWTGFGPRFIEIHLSVLGAKTEWSWYKSYISYYYKWSLIGNEALGLIFASFFPHWKSKGIVNVLLAYKEYNGHNFLQHFFKYEFYFILLSLKLHIIVFVCKKSSIITFWVSFHFDHSNALQPHLFVKKCLLYRSWFGTQFLLSEPDMRKYEMWRFLKKL